MAFFAPSASLPLISILRLLALWFWLWAPVSGGPCVCVGFFLRRRSCVFFLSSCLVWGRLLLSLFWCGFCASSWGACGFPRRVLPLVPPSRVPQPFWLQLAGLLLQWRLVVGLAVSLGHHLVFYLVPCSSSGACGLHSFPCRSLPLRVFCLFCHQVPDQLLLWWRRLGGNPSLIFLCFSCAGWLAGVCWVLHPVSGCSRWGCVCSLGDSVMTLLAFPYLRVGALLA